MVKAGSRGIVGTMGLALTLGFTPAARADEGQANALFVAAVLAWQEAEALTARDPATLGRRVELLETVSDNLEEIVHQHPDAGLAVRLVIGEAIGPLSLTSADAALNDARAAMEARNEPCFAQPTTACLLDVLRGGDLGFSGAGAAILLAETGRKDEALELLSDAYTLMQFLDGVPIDVLSLDFIEDLAGRVERSPGGIYSALVASQLARAAAEVDPASELARRLVADAKPLVAASRDEEEQAESLVNLGAARRSLGDVDGALQAHQEASDKAGDLEEWGRRDIAVLLAREWIRVGQPRMALDIITDLVAPERRHSVLYDVVPDFIETNTLDELAEAATALGEEYGVGVFSTALSNLAENGRADEAMLWLDQAPAGQQAHLRLAIAAGQAKAGDAAGAAATLATLPAKALTDPDLPAALVGSLTQVAVAQWEAGDRAGARRRMDQAAAVLDNLMDPEERQFLLRSLATAEARIGNLEEAHRYTDLAIEASRVAGNPSAGDLIAAMLAREMAVGGHGVEAVRVARSIEDEISRLYALMGIARALWEAEER